MTRMTSIVRRRPWLLTGVVLLAGSLGARAQAWTFGHFAGATASGAGSHDGSGAAAKFTYPSGVAADGANALYIADTDNHLIRKISPGGEVTTLAGLAGMPGSADGAGAAARFNSPYGIAVDGAGIVYVADTNNHTIRKISPAGVVATLAGLAGSSGSADGTGAGARFKSPYALAADGGGTLYVADTSNQTIRKISPAGVVTTLAGSAGLFGSADGTGATARFYNPRGITVDASGTLFVSDSTSHTIRKVTAAGGVTTFAGTAGAQGSVDGTGNSARFNTPYGIAVDSAGNLFVADSGNSTLRMITSSRVVTTPAGLAGWQGAADGTGSSARFVIPRGVAVDSAGDAYVADPYNYALRKVTPAGVVTTAAGRLAEWGSADGTGGDARFYTPSGVALDSTGAAYVGDTYNNTVRRIAPDGTVSTLAGLAGASGSTDGTGDAARFSYPWGVATDASGTVYVADYANHTIRKISPVGAVTTLAGLAGSAGGWDGAGSAARFNFPRGIAADPGGMLYVADTSNHTIRKITPSGGVTTLAGSPGLSGSADGTGGAARFKNPSGIAVDSGGVVYVGDSGNHTLRKITPLGVVTTLAGSAGFSGSADGTGSAARFNSPSGIGVSAAGDIFVAESSNHAIRRITPGGEVTTVAGLAGWRGSSDGTGGAARFNGPWGLAIDDAGTRLLVTETSNHAVRQGVPSIPDAAFVDAVAGCAGEVRRLDAAPATATAWQWRIIRRPVNSGAALSDSAIRNPAFTPDVVDRYEFLLTASNDAGARVTTVTLDAAATFPIDTQPFSQTVCAGGGASFTVAAAAATACQWYRDGAPVGGATQTTLLIDPVATGDAGSYRAALTGPCGIRFSDPAALGVLVSPASPGNSLALARTGGLVSLAWGAASGATGYAVKRCDGACIPDITVGTPAAAGYAEPDDEGSHFYSVEAGNACGSTP